MFTSFERPQTCVSNSSLIRQTRDDYLQRGGIPPRITREKNCLWLGDVFVWQNFSCKKRKKTEADTTSVQGKKVIYSRVWGNLTISTFCIWGKGVFHQSLWWASQTRVQMWSQATEEQTKNKPVSPLTPAIVFLSKSNFCFSAPADSSLVNSVIARLRTRRNWSRTSSSGVRAIS